MLGRGGTGSFILMALLALSVVFLAIDGDLSIGEHTIVTVTSTAEVSGTTISDDQVKQNHIKSLEGDVSVRTYCHAVCESSYNQLQVNDTLFIPNNGSVDIISGHHPDIVTHQRVFIPGCDPLAAIFDKKAVLLCCSINNSLTVFGVVQQSASWLVTEPYKCVLSDDSAMVRNVGIIFRSSLGSIYVAFTTTIGLGVCSLTSDQPYFIPIPSNCPYIAKLSQFDAENILVECTSSKDSQSVVQVGLFSISGARFVQQLPLQQYDVGQIMFSGDRLIVVTWKDKTVKLANLSESNPLSATVVAKGNVDSAHIVGSGITSELVVVAKGGVEQYDLHAVFDGNAEPRTLKGSENVLTRFDEPSSPTAQVVDRSIIIPTQKDGTYGMALLSPNEDKPKVIPGVHPARFAVYRGADITDPTGSTLGAKADGGFYGAIAAAAGGGGGGIGIIFTAILLLLLVVAICKTRKKHHNNPYVVQERDAGSSSGVLNAQSINVSQGPSAICLCADRGEVVYHRMPLFPDNASNDVPQGIIVEPLQEQHPPGIEQNTSGPPQDRGNADGRER